MHFPVDLDSLEKGGVDKIQVSASHIISAEEIVQFVLLLIGSRLELGFGDPGS